MKYCPKCKIDKTLNEFSQNKTREDGKCRVCRKCQAEYDNKHYKKDKTKHIKRRQENQQNYNRWLKEYKESIECSKCKNNKWYLLDFHHKNPNEKKFNIGDFKKRSIKPVLEEIKKCVPLCSNCHREFHYLEKINGIKIHEYLGVAE